MRGKLSEQDLTNYALNDGLDARERLYVESMLGVSEECRGDVYKMLDMAQLLERGFAQESDRTIPSLTRIQREMLLNAKPRFEIFPMVRKTAANLALAASVAFVLANPAGWHFGNHTRTMADMSEEVAQRVTEAFGTAAEDDYTMWVAPQSVNEDDSTLIQASSDGMPAQQAVEAICTPPTWQQQDIGESIEAM
jgi:anti-sigma factor RsiW